jgi:Na+/H+ antiporter NhaD/arsenite permease-like protein
LILPFVAMLAAIACAPLVLRHHWERHYHEVSVVLGAIPVGYYLFVLKNSERVGHLLHEYVSFITLIGSLFVVAGGIQFTIRGGARPWANLLFLFAGAIGANIFGTTGAAMLLIRPWIRMNQHRFGAFHTVFFIFIVANVGGCLTPIANPPLFLGFIQGVPFWWVLEHCWPAWAIVNAGLLLIFYVFDKISFRNSPPPPHEPAGDRFALRGAHNLVFFAVIIGSLFIPNPPFLREALMVAAAIASCATTSGEAHLANGFTFAPIQEVAWLFAGIFATMLPALDYLNVHSRQMGISSPMHFYWLSGGLSAVLDNAPTYLAFTATAFGLHDLSLNRPGDVAFFLVHDPIHMLAISIGAVLFGAMTYLGNGPNLMVKSISESYGVPTPNFAAYVFRYALPILLPLLALVAWIFFR